MYYACVDRSKFHGIQAITWVQDKDDLNEPVLCASFRYVADYQTGHAGELRVRHSTSLQGDSETCPRTLTAAGKRPVIPLSQSHHWKMYLVLTGTLGMLVVKWRPRRTPGQRPVSPNAQH